MKFRLFCSNGYSSEIILLVAGIILIILTGVFYILNPVSMFKQERDVQRYTDMRLIQTALEKYYEDYGMYPTYSDNFQIVDARHGELDWGSGWKPYLDKVPQDPSKDRQYVYYSNPNLNNQSYVIYASFEIPKKSDFSCFPDGKACVGVPKGAVCGGVCNVGLSSTNISP